MLLPFTRATPGVTTYAPCTGCAVYTADALEGWLNIESYSHAGLRTKRNLKGVFEDSQADIDSVGMLERWGRAGTLSTSVMNGSPRQLSRRLQAAVTSLLEEAVLPERLSTQIRDDACNVGILVGRMCGFARTLEVKLEIFGENSCRRWHQDHYAARAIVSYSGEVGTAYSADENVDFKQLRGGGVNAEIIRCDDGIEHVDVGDILFIKGVKFPQGASGLVHKSPEPRYHGDGSVIHRLILKIDVASQ